MNSISKSNIMNPITMVKPMSSPSYKSVIHPNNGILKITFFNEVLRDSFYFRKVIIIVESC